MPNNLSIGLQIPRQRVTTFVPAPVVNGVYFGRRFFGGRFFGRRYFG